MLKFKSRVCSLGSEFVIRFQRAYCPCLKKYRYERANLIVPKILHLQMKKIVFIACILRRPIRET